MHNRAYSPPLDAVITPPLQYKVGLMGPRLPLPSSPDRGRSAVDSIPRDGMPQGSRDGAHLELEFGAEHVRIDAEDDLFAEVAPAHESEHPPQRVVERGATVLRRHAV